MIEHSKRIVIFGMSCVGKTTFAQDIPRRYLCFDALFPWHSMETLGLPFGAAMERVKSECECLSEFVLDGWHLGDEGCWYFPSGTTAYVLISPYYKIIEQYRVSVDDPNQHLGMFKNWYSIKYPSPTRYFVNDGSFVEISEKEFITCREQSLKIATTSEIQGIVPSQPFQ